MNAAAVLAWLSQFARHVHFQQIPAGRRRKNAVILSYCAPGSDDLKVVGGSTLAVAVVKAALRSQAHCELISGSGIS